jgi:hypothetical protein
MSFGDIRADVGLKSLPGRKGDETHEMTASPHDRLHGNRGALSGGGGDIRKKDRPPRSRPLPPNVKNAGGSLRMAIRYPTPVLLGPTGSGKNRWTNKSSSNVLSLFLTEELVQADIVQWRHGPESPVKRRKARVKCRTVWKPVCWAMCLIGRQF